MSSVFSLISAAPALADDPGPTASSAPPRAEAPANRPPEWPAVIAFQPSSAPATQGGGERHVTIHLGQELEFELEASDPDGDTITYTAVKIPEHAVFDTARGAFAWRPSPGDVGSHILRFSVSDGAKRSVLTVQVLVRENQPPDTSGAEEMATQFFVGDHVRYRFSVDHDGDRLRLTTSSLPRGATLRMDGSDLMFDWTPTARDTGSHDLAFVISDGELQRTFRKTVYVHPDWDNTNDKAYFAPSAGYVVNPRLDRRLLMGPDVELTLFAIRRGGYEAYACGRRTTAECAPSHHRFYLSFETLFPVHGAGPSEAGVSPLFTYAFGLTRSFEFAPDRRWLVPHYGLELGAMTESSQGTFAEVTSFVGMHLWTDRHVWLNLTAGARIVPADIERRSGARANLTLMIDAW